MDCIRNKIGFICDMDGVIYHGRQILPGVKELSSGCKKKANASCS